MSKIRVIVEAPKGMPIPKSLGSHVASILRRADIAYGIEKIDEASVIVTLPDPKDSEARFLIRMLKRAKYNLTVQEQ